MANPQNIFNRGLKGDAAIQDIYDKLAYLLAQTPTTPIPTPTPVLPVVPVTPAVTPGGGGGGGGNTPTQQIAYVPLLQALPSNNPGQGAPYAVDGFLVDVGGVIYRYAGAPPFTGATPTYQWQAVGVSEATIAEAEWLLNVAGTNTITGNTAIAYTALAVGFKVILVPANTNTGTVTLNVNGIGASAVTKNGTNALNGLGGELVAGRVYLLIWDGTEWQILGVIGPRSAFVLASGSDGVPTAAVLADTNIWIGNGLSLPIAKAVSGDATLADTGALTLATVNASPGTYTNATVTVNGKGLATTVTSGSGSATPSGPAGGGLAGTYPNPSVAIIFAAVVGPPVLIAALPGTPSVGEVASVSNAVAPIIGSAVAGTGTAFAAVMWNGSQWTVFSV